MNASTVCRSLALFGLVACSGLKDPDWDTAGQSLQGGSDWRDAPPDGDDGSGTGSESSGDETGSGAGGESSGSTDAGSDGGGSGETAGSDVGGETSGTEGGETGSADGGGDETGSGESGGGDSGGGETGAAAGVGGLVQFIYNVNAYAVELGVPVVEVSALGRLHSPMVGSWLAWMPSLGMCTLDPFRASLGATGLALGGSATLTSATSVVPMLLDESTNTYKAEGLPMSSWANTSGYDIQFSDGLAIDDVVITTAGFDELSPPVLAEGDTVYPFYSGLSMSGTTFEWSPAGLDDGLLISLVVMDPTTMVEKGELLCNAPDMGTFTIPSSAFYSSPAFSVGDPVFAGIWRYRHTYSLSPIDGSAVEGFAQKGAVGTATLVP